MQKGNEGIDAIKDAGDEARRLWVDSVPFFVINGQITLSGAQQPAAYLEAIGKAVGGK